MSANCRWIRQNALQLDVFLTEAPEIDGLVVAFRRAVLLGCRHAPAVQQLGREILHRRNEAGSIAMRKAASGEHALAFGGATCTGAAADLRRATHGLHERRGPEHATQ